MTTVEMISVTDKAGSEGVREEVPLGVFVLCTAERNSSTSRGIMNLELRSCCVALRAFNLPLGSMS
jgi:hypothetical protein